MICSYLCVMSVAKGTEHWTLDSGLWTLATTHIHKCAVPSGAHFQCQGVMISFHYHTFTSNVHCQSPVFNVSANVQCAMPLPVPVPSADVQCQVSSAVLQSLLPVLNISIWFFMLVSTANGQCPVCNTTAMPQCTEGNAHCQCPVAACNVCLQCPMPVSSAMVQFQCLLFTV